MDSFCYVPGSHTAVIVWPVCVLIGLDPADDRVGAVYTALSREASVDAALDQLVSAGLSRMPAFGLVQLDGTQARVVVRGEMRGTTGDGVGIVSSGVFTDRTVDAANGVGIMVADETPAGVRWPIRDGIVAAGWLGLDAAGGVAPQAGGVAPQAGPQRAIVPATADVGVESGGVEDGVGEPDGPAEVAVTDSPAVDDDSADDQKGAEPDPGEDASDGGAVDAEADDDEMAPGTTCDDQSEAEASGTPEASESPEASHADAVADPGETQVPADLMDSVEELLADAPVPAAPAAPVTPPPFITSFDWRHQAAAVPAMPPRAEGQTLIDDLTMADDGLAAADASDQASPSDEDDDLGGATISRSDLERSAGEIVAAVRCPTGHLNPPFASTCRVCRAQIPAQQPVQVARPALGVLRLSNGAVLTLDRGAILGRNPRALPGAEGLPPNLVRIDDPTKDVSSQHLEVRLEGWFVTVRDLNSTNGTEVTLPGRAPFALRANEPVTIESGTRVQLASTLEFVFEASD